MFLKSLQLLDNATIAAFLAGAGEGHYLTIGGWHGGTQGHWGDAFARPLGPPLADATWNGSAPESIEYKMMPRDQTSALAASYPLSSVAIRTSGAAYMSDPHFVC